MTLPLRANQTQFTSRHSPHSPVHWPAVDGGGLGIDLKTVALKREQFRQQMFRLRAMFGMNEVPEAGSVGDPLAVAQHVLQRGIQGDDVARALKLRKCKGSVLFSTNFESCGVHVISAAVLIPPTWLGLIPGRNQLLPRRDLSFPEMETWDSFSSR